MAGKTGKDDVLTFAGQDIPNITKIDVDNSVNEITEETADGTLTETGNPKWSFAVSFVSPASAAHTLEGAIKAGEVGAFTGDVSGVRYTKAAVKSLGFTKSSTPSAFTAYNLKLGMDGEPTLAAAS